MQFGLCGLWHVFRLRYTGLRLKNALEGFSVAPEAARK